MNHRSFRFRLMAVILIGMLGLAITNVLSNQWMLNHVRDRAISDGSDALRQQAIASFQRQMQQRAETTNQSLTAIKLIASTASEMLSESRAAGQSSQGIALSTSPDGWRYQQGVTTLLVPPGDNPQALVDAALSTRMNVGFPGLVRAFPEISRISYLASSGVYRTFPQTELARLPESWLPQNNPAFQAHLPENNPGGRLIWWEPHQDIATFEQVISSVAPVYINAQLAGVVIVDINLETLTRGIRGLGGEFGGFGFVSDHVGHLVSASEEGQRTLIGRLLLPEERGAVTLDAANAALQPLMANMRLGKSAVETVVLDGRSHFVAYQPIPELEWSISVMAPVDQVTAAIGPMAQGIGDIARTAQARGLLISLLVVVLLCAILVWVIHRQFSRPLAQLVSATEAIAAGNLQRIDNVGAGELGQLARLFNTMTAALETSRSEIMAANQRLELTVQERTADLNRTVCQLEESLSTQQSLLHTLREVSTPIIPVVEGVLAMPLIGQLDSERLRNATQALLCHIERVGARTVLLDMTGVPMIDTEVAQALLSTVTSGRLLGARVILVGITPEVAQTVVSFGMDLCDMQTSSDLQSAIERVLANRSLGRSTPQRRLMPN